MSVRRDKRTGHWYYDFQLQRRRFYGCCTADGEPVTSKRDAQSAEAKAREAARKELARAARQRTGPLTLDLAAGRFWSERGQFYTNADDTWRDLNRLVAHFGKATLIRDITDFTLAELVAMRRGEGVSNATVNRTVTELLRRVLRRAAKVWRQDLPDMPDWTEHLLPEPKERVRELSAAEETAIEVHLRADYRPLWRFSLATGLRMGEAFTLTWSQVDWQARVVAVVGKGDKPDLVPLTAEAIAVLSLLRGHHGERVFTYEAARARAGRRAGRRYPITENGLKTAWRRARAKAVKECPSLATFRWHDNRHTAATRVLRASGNLVAVQKMLRHEDIATTAKYAHAMLDDVRAAMEADAKLRKKSRKRLSAQGEKPDAATG